MFLSLSLVLSVSLSLALPITHTNPLLHLHLHLHLMQVLRVVDDSDAGDGWVKVRNRLGDEGFVPREFMSLLPLSPAPAEPGGTPRHTTTDNMESSPLPTLPSGDLTKSPPSGNSYGSPQFESQFEDTLYYAGAFLLFTLSLSLTLSNPH